MKQPFFSIVVPTYNRAELLIPTIESLLNQNYPHFEIILVDDGSTDNTKEVVLNLKNDKIRYIFQTNAERGAARNQGARAAKGNYINFFDSDDIAYNNHLELAAKHILENPEVPVFTLSFDRRTPGGLLIDSRILKGNREKNLVHGNEFSCNGIFIRKQICLEFPFSTNRNLSATEDYDLWLKLGARFPITAVPVPSHAIIEHDLRSVNAFNLKQLIGRADNLRNSIDADSQVKSFYGSSITNRVYAHMLSYISIHAAVEGQRMIALQYLFKSASVYFPSLLSRRTLGILKHLILQ